MEKGGRKGGERGRGRGGKGGRADREGGGGMVETEGGQREEELDSFAYKEVFQRIPWPVFCLAAHPLGSHYHDRSTARSSRSERNPKDTKQKYDYQSTFTCAWEFK